MRDACVASSHRPRGGLGAGPPPPAPRENRMWIGGWGQSGPSAEHTGVGFGVGRRHWGRWGVRSSGRIPSHDARPGRCGVDVAATGAALRDEIGSGGPVDQLLVGSASPGLRPGVVEARTSIRGAEASGWVASSRHGARWRGQEGGVTSATGPWTSEVSARARYARPGVELDRTSLGGSTPMGQAWCGPPWRTRRPACELSGPRLDFHEAAGDRLLEAIRCRGNRFGGERRHAGRQCKGSPSPEARRSRRRHRGRRSRSRYSPRLSYLVTRQTRSEGEWRGENPSE